MTHKILAASLLLTISLLIISSYFLIDQAVSYTYLESSYSHSTQKVSTLIKIIESEWQGESLETVKEKLDNIKETSSEMIILKEFPDENILTMNEMAFSFENGKLATIQ